MGLYTGRHLDSPGGSLVIARTRLLLSNELVAAHVRSRAPGLFRNKIQLAGTFLVAPGGLPLESHEMDVLSHPLAPPFVDLCPWLCRTHRGHHRHRRPTADGPARFGLGHGPRGRSREQLSHGQARRPTPKLLYVSGFAGGYEGAKLPRLVGLGWGVRDPSEV